MIIINTIDYIYKETNTNKLQGPTNKLIQQIHNNNENAKWQLFTGHPKPIKQKHR